MNRIYEKLFDAYAQPLLMKDQEVQIFLEPLAISDDMRLELTDTLNSLRLQWSTDAFALGLHLGLSLLHDDVRRARPQQA